MLALIIKYYENFEEDVNLQIIIPLKYFLNEKIK